MEDKDKKRGVFESTMYVGNLVSSFMVWLSIESASSWLTKEETVLALRKSRITYSEKSMQCLQDELIDSSSFKQDLAYVC